MLGLDIGINKNALVTSYPLNTGVGTYAYELFRLGLFKDFLFFKTVFHGFEDGFSDIISPISRASGIIKKGSSLFLKYNVYNRKLEKYSNIHFADPDFFHLAKYNNSIGTIHDVFPLQEETKKDYSLAIRKYYRYELEQADRLGAVVTVSNVSRRLIQEFYPNIDPVVIKLWTNELFIYRDRNKVRKSLGLPLDKFILLSVGGDFPRKNVDLLPKIMNKMDNSFLLIRIGDSHRIVNKFKNKNFLCIPKVNNNIYHLFFNAANVVLMTSFVEGFGIPVIQAINSKVPLLLTNIQIFKEIVGNYKYYLNPYDIDDWINKILEIREKSSDSLFSTQLYSNISDYYRRERAMGEYVKLYKQIGFI